MLVVDASVALKWFKQEDGSELAERLPLTDAIAAPDLLVAELGNAVWKAWRRSLMTEAQARDVPRILGDYVAALHPIEPLWQRTQAIALALDHPVYDCFYLALAEREAATLVTADRRLISRVMGTAWASTVQDLSTWTTT